MRRTDCLYTDCRKIAGSRFQLNVTAGSQKRAIANLRKSKGRDESRFALKLKRNLDFNCKSRSLSIFCHYWEKHCRYWDKHCHYWDNQFVWAFSRCVENDSWGALMQCFFGMLWCHVVRYVRRSVCAIIVAWL
jgi:hypothetical protein